LCIALIIANTQDYLCNPEFSTIANVRQECRMHDRESRNNHRYLKLVRTNAVLSDENENRAKT